MNIMRKCRIKQRLSQDFNNKKTANYKKNSAHPELASILLQILIPTTFYKKDLSKRAICMHFSHVLEEGSQC